ncbi:MAG: ABC transporter [Rhodospirillaceae bacterium]|nr:ABC transporter [Rhodospirillaceae bacterium]
MSVIAAEALSIGYGSTVVASDIDLTIEAGSVTCLIGPNGAGKTTLFKTMLGLIPPLGGLINVDGAPIGRLKRAEIAHHVAYVPQAQFSEFAFTVLDLVVMGRTAHLGLFAAPRQTDVDAAMSALERLGIASLAERDIRRISGGQRQLALIARALVQEAALIVMDEPTASLDLGNRLLVLDTIRSLAVAGPAVLVSTHEPEQAFAIADQVALLGRGTGCEVGPVDTVLTADRLSRLYGTALLVEATPSGRRVVGAALDDPLSAPSAGS